MTIGDKYYKTITYLNGKGETCEQTSGPFEYRDPQLFLDQMQSSMRGYCSGAKVRIWTEVYYEWEGPWKNIEFSFVVG